MTQRLLVVDRARGTGRPRTLSAGLALATLLAVALTGCGSEDGGPAGSSASSASPSSGSSAAARSGMGGGQRQPGVSGLVAAVDGKTLQVQGADGQTAVTWTGKTTFTTVTAATADALEAGVCVTVRGSSTTSAAPDDQVAAGAVTISPPVDGECTGGFGGGARPSGMPSGRPTADPSSMPSGRPGGAGGGATGTVTSVDGSSFVVESSGPADDEDTTSVTATTSDETTWEQVTASTAEDATVGHCASAQGTTDDTGALTATSIRISKPSDDGTCSTGRGAGGQGAGGPGAGASTETEQNDG